MFILLSACTLTAPSGGKAPPVTSSSIMGEVISTTALDAPAASGKDVRATAPTPQKRPAAMQESDANVAVNSEKPDSGKVDPNNPVEAKAANSKADSEKVAPIAETPAVPALTEAGQACVKKGGLWGKIGKGNGLSCQTKTRDGGKECQRGNQCEGYCLARSHTCAPYKPLFGCNDILQDNGVEVTLCLD